jgi:hypothetical protein
VVVPAGVDQQYSISCGLPLVSAGQDTAPAFVSVGAAGFAAKAGIKAKSRVAESKSVFMFHLIES